MITLIVFGAGLLVVIAVVVGILDVTQASAWRAIATQRRELWEARQPARHGVDRDDADGWDDD
jgi:hypothetical protein